MNYQFIKGGVKKLIIQDLTPGTIAVKEIAACQSCPGPDLPGRRLTAKNLEAGQSQATTVH